MPATAQLTLNGHHYDIELLNQSFYLSTGWNGHPKIPCLVTDSCVYR